MFDNDLVMNTGTRAAATLLLGKEMQVILTDSRWMLLAILVCVVADFRYGWGESARRYCQAKRDNDRIGMEAYRWHTSRAWRRTVNKFIDYLIWVSVGMFLGMAVLEPIGLPHIYGGVAATAIAVFCEARSFCGHFFYLRGVTVKKKTLLGFMRAFAVALAKRKDEDIGEALEKGFDGIDDTRH